MSLSLCSLVHAASLERFFGDCMNRIEPGTKKGLRDRNSPTCTLSQNGYGVSKQSASNHPVVPAAEPHHKPLRLLATFAYRKCLRHQTSPQKGMCMQHQATKKRVGVQTQVSLRWSSMRLLSAFTKYTLLASTHIVQTLFILLATTLMQYCAIWVLVSEHHVR